MDRSSSLPRDNPHAAEVLAILVRTHQALAATQRGSVPLLPPELDNSLEAAINRLGTPQSLPLLTIADPDWLMRDRDYAELAAVQLLELLLDLEIVRGLGRLYVP